MELVITKWMIEGREYDYDGKILLSDAMFIHEKSGVGVAGINRALLGDGSRPGDSNPNAIAAWCFLLKRRAGEAVRYDDMAKIDISTFQPVFEEKPSEDEPTEKSAGEAADPTTRNGTTRRRGSTRTT